MQTILRWPRELNALQLQKTHANMFQKWRDEGMFLKTLPLKNAHSRFSVHLRLLCEWQQREIFNFCYELKVETEFMNMIKLDLQYDEQPTCFTDSLQSCHLQLNCWSFKCHTQREIFLKIIILATVKPVNSFYS